MRLQRDVEQLIQQNPQAFPQPSSRGGQPMRRLMPRRVAGVVRWPCRRAAQNAGGRRGARPPGRSASAYDGYLGVAAPPSPALRSQVGAINIRRRSLYSNLAASRGVTPAGSRDHRRLPAARRGSASGEAYLLADGVWRRRAPGSPRPFPITAR